MTRRLLASLLMATVPAPMVALQIPALLSRTPCMPAAPPRAAVPFMCSAEEEAPADVAAEGADDPKAALKAEKAALREAIAELEKQLPAARGELAAAIDGAKDAGENGYLLLAANFERFRQQARTELDSQKGYGRVAAVRSLLPFAESFESLQEGAAVDGDEGAAIHKYYGGIYKQSQQLLDSWQVTPYEAKAGETFDFKLHQATERLNSDDVPENTIIAGLERGFKMGDEVVRLAKCTVSLGPEVAEEPPTVEATAEPEADGAQEAA